MSYLKIWVHMVFSTHNREPFLNDKIRKDVFKHILEKGREKDIWIDHVGGHIDHAHVLFSLVKRQTIADIAQQIKGESSHWINKENLIQDQFRWQDDYYAVSVSESHLPKVRTYIQNQDEHHRKVSFAEEVDLFMKHYGWKLLSDVAKPN